MDVVGGTRQGRLLCNEEVEPPRGHTDDGWDRLLARGRPTAPAQRAAGTCGARATKYPSIRRPGEHVCRVRLSRRLRSVLGLLSARADGRRAAGDALRNERRLDAS